MASFSHFTLLPLSSLTASSSSSSSSTFLRSCSSTSSQSLRSKFQFSSLPRFLSKSRPKKKATHPERLLMIINPIFLFHGVSTSTFNFDTQTLLTTVSVLAAIALSFFLGFKVKKVEKGSFCITLGNQAVAHLALCKMKTDTRCLYTPKTNSMKIKVWVLWWLVTHSHNTYAAKVLSLVQDICKRRRTH